MDALQIALIVLVSIWSIIFLIIAGAVLVIFFAVKRLVDKANNVLDQAEDIADRVDLPSKVVIASVLAFVGKNSVGGLKSLIGNFLKGNKRK